MLKSARLSLSVHQTGQNGENPEVVAAVLFIHRWENDNDEI